MSLLLSSPVPVELGWCDDDYGDHRDDQGRGPVGSGNNQVQGLLGRVRSVIVGILDGEGIGVIPLLAGLQVEYGGTVVAGLYRPEKRFFCSRKREAADGRPNRRRIRRSGVLYPDCQAGSPAVIRAGSVLMEATLISARPTMGIPIVSTCRNTARSALR